VVGVEPSAPDCLTDGGPLHPHAPYLDQQTRYQVYGTTIALYVGADVGDADSLYSEAGPRTGKETRQHAVAPTWVAALIRGASGSGKSDLALRCLAQPLNALFPSSARAFGARLVADDRTDLTTASGPSASAVSVPVASAPASISGLLEVRGLGVVAVPQVSLARLILVVDLAPADLVPRYPDHATVSIGPDGHVSILPRVVVAPFEIASPLKLLLALVRTALNGTPVGSDATKHHYLPEGQ
jgi:HPr kinase/phosphorylase